MTNAGKNSWASWLVFLVGLWLVFAPTLLGYSDLATPSGNSVVVGFAIAALGFINAVWGRFTEPWLGWVAAAIGLWEILAPFFWGTLTLQQLQPTLLLAELR